MKQFLISKIQTAVIKKGANAGKSYKKLYFSGLKTANGITVNNQSGSLLDPNRAICRVVFENDSQLWDAREGLDTVLGEIVVFRTNIPFRLQEDGHVGQKIRIFVYEGENAVAVGQNMLKGLISTTGAPVGIIVDDEVIFNTLSVSGTETREIKIKRLNAQKDELLAQADSVAKTDALAKINEELAKLAKA